VDTLTLISGRWMPSRLRFPLLFLLPLVLLGSSLLPGKRFLPLLPVTQEPLASELPADAVPATSIANHVATDRIFPILSDELEIREQLASGTLPTWNPDLGLGMPLAASSMAAPWNPMRWPLLLLEPDVAGAWHALLALVAAGMGMLLFLEGRGLKFTAAFFGALALQGSGFMVANLHYVMKVDALAWAPWCLWGVDMVFRGRRNAGLVLFCGLGLSALAGFPPVFFFVVVLTLAWIMVRALEAIRVEREARFWKRSLASALAFAGLGVLAGAVHLVPMWEASTLSTRADQEPTTIQAQSLPGIALATSVLPAVFGSPQDVTPASSDPALWWLLEPEDLLRGLTANRLEWHLFAGVTVLGLALAGLFMRQRTCAFPLLMVLCAWGFVFDWPGLEFLYGLPGTNLGAPARAAGIAGLGLAWLAALGFDALLEGHRPARLGAHLVASAGIGLGIYLWWTVEPGRWAEDIDELLLSRHGLDLATLREYFSREEALRAAGRVSAASLSLLLFSTGLFIVASYAGRLTVRGSGVAGCALLLVELAYAGLPWTNPVPIETAELFPRSDTIEAIAEATGDGRVLRVDQSESRIDEVLRLARPNLLSVYGVKDLTPYTIFPSKALAELWRAFDPEGLYRDGVARLSDPALLESPVLDVLRVTCILSTRPLASPVLTPRYEREGFHVYARSGALGQARLALEDPDTGTQPPLLTAPSESGSQWINPDGLSRIFPDQELRGELTVTRPSANRMDIGVSDAQGGRLVVHEGWAPGWKATVNGRDAEVRRMDHLYFGVSVPAGNSLVRFKYEPWSLRIGAALSLLALFGAVMLTVRRHRGQVPPHPFFHHAPSSSR
jgi:hypothetical protein